jgi:hypothetical protein
VIVRLMTAGQYRLDDDLRAKLNELDEQAVAALERDDEEALDAHLEQMWDLVRLEGEELPIDSLETSDVIVPPADLTLEETRALFSDEGLIPDLPG